MAPFLELTAIQEQILGEYRRRGFRQGVQKTWARLRQDYTFDDGSLQDHYAVDKDGGIAWDEVADRPLEEMVTPQ